MVFRQRVTASVGWETRGDLALSFWSARRTSSFSAVVYHATKNIRKLSLAVCGAVSEFFSWLLVLAKCCLYLEQCFKIDCETEIVFFIGRFLYTDLLYGGGLDQAQKESALAIFIFRHANTLHS